MHAIPISCCKQILYAAFSALCHVMRGQCCTVDRNTPAGPSPLFTLRCMSCHLQAKPKNLTDQQFMDQINDTLIKVAGLDAGLDGGDSGDEGEGLETAAATGPTAGAALRPGYAVGAAKWQQQDTLPQLQQQQQQPRMAAVVAGNDVGSVGSGSRRASQQMVGTPQQQQQQQLGPGRQRASMAPQVQPPAGTRASDGSRLRPTGTPASGPRATRSSEAIQGWLACMLACAA